MFLSEMVGKRIYSAGKIRGICRGVGVTVKSRSVKYLLCADTENERELFLPIGSVEQISNDGIRLKSFRPAAPRSVARFFCGRPVYADTGEYLGITADLEMVNFYAVSLVTDAGKVYSALSIAALSDAVILKKRPAFPLGERIPDGYGEKTAQKDPVVTKSTLKKAIDDGALISFTLSLPLFAG